MIFAPTRTVAAVAVSFILIGGGAIRSTVEPLVRGPEALSLADRRQVERSASASLFGELRGGLADYLWLKADRLLHNGVEMRAVTPSEEKDGRRWRVEHVHEEHAVGAHLDEVGKTTTIPNRAADHRGLLGDLERHVKPFMDVRSHGHRDVGDTAALFRLMTWANPRFIEAWVIGADVLVGALHRPREALAFLREAEAENPESIEIQTELGRCLLYQFHDTPAAEPHFRRAIALGAARATRTADEEEAWENAHRWLVILCHRAGHQAEATRVAREAIGRFPESGWFRRALERPEVVGEASHTHPSGE